MLLPDSQVVKMGTHAPRDDKPELFLMRGIPYAEVLDAIVDCAFLILESGSVLDDADLEPDLVIYLPAPDGRQDKPGSQGRRARANLVRGESVSDQRIGELSKRLGLKSEMFEQILTAAGIPHTSSLSTDSNSS